ncbi:MAG TPA: 2-succinyl-5-enolpyruvyl-6-hydroxy-3-cyclohexene-1-carboxylic-acid synthase [Mycobacteriales bacterium]|nr:2-succinyl-5-enolpyruvyl-6-hydroxy-3-cyclohexene-1-carboxylic-acid synthase [Mycobacteriales bacterium]
MNPATACARVIVDELVRCGVRDAVLSPGSRSAPLAMALHAADAAARLRLHVRIDERSAGFLALGLAKGSRRPVPVATTSGTAAANLFPAVLEADAAGVALLALTADRPGRLQGSGANQMTDQVKLYGSAVRGFWQVEVAAGGGNDAWRALAGRAVADALGVRTGAPGPVHLNLAFDLPLLPGDEPAEPLGGRSAEHAWTTFEERPPAPAVALAHGPRTVVVAGDDAGPPARQLAEQGGWPLLAEPTSGARTGANAIRCHRLLLEDEALGGGIERVVVFGHPTLSRQVLRLLSRADVEVVAVAPTGRWTDVGHTVSQVLAAVTVATPGDEQWLTTWRDADSAVAAAVDAVVGDEPALTAYAVAAALGAALPADGLLVVGSSNPIRDLDLMAPVPGVGGRRRILANRGLSGIDGTVSTAVGAALGRRSSVAYALLGDLTFLHDCNGLLIGPAEPRPDLSVVVVNDDGGGIFGLLEQGAPAYAGPFERIFGTPHGADLAALCAAYGTVHTLAADVEQLRALLREPGAGLRVVEARVDRAGRRELERRLSQAATAALRA